MEKYFLINETTGFSVFIYEKNYTGASTEINGRISFDKGSVKDILEPIRGTGLSLQLQANSNLTFDEFSEADEKTYTVEVRKNSKIFFNGFLKPDGITQSFVQELWIINLDFVDGLGALKELAFVNSAGNNFVGKLSMFEIIQGCLSRTELVMNINSSVKLKYLGYNGTNILKDTYLNADRFFKIDAQASQGGTTMTCEEVLNSVLNIISACITQQDGAWWIYRPNEFETNIDWTNNTTDTIFTKNLYIELGSQIDNFYPHHCNGNQQIETKGAISAYRINYKYGFKSGILLNPNLKHDANLVFENWTINDELPILVTNPERQPLIPYIALELLNEQMNGLKVKKRPGQYEAQEFTVDVATSNSIYVQQGEQLTLNFKGSTFFYEQLFSLVVKTNTGLFLRKIPNQNNYEWTLTNSNITIPCGVFSTEEQFVTAEILMPQMPTNCNINIVIQSTFVPYFASEFISNNLIAISNISYINIVNTSIINSNKVGEFHTITRNISPSSITKENQEVYNGDSTGDVFEGAIYKADKSTLTTKWTRTDWVEEKSILRISGEDDMRIAQKPQKVFIGDFYGYVPYLSIVSINNLVGKFMFIEHSYDTDTNITRCKLKQFYTNEIGDILYALTSDFGNTVKPSIKS